MTMQAQQFFDWMLESGYNKDKIKAFVANCEKVETYEGDLDSHFQTDRCVDLLQKLRYTLKDKASIMPIKHSIPIVSNAFKETDAYKQAVKFYEDFLIFSEQQALKHSMADDNHSKVYAKRSYLKAAPADLDFSIDNDSYYNQFKPRKG